MRPHLLRWQYDGYSQFHSNRMNLLIHIVAVPAFVASSVWLAWCALLMHWAELGVAMLAVVVSFLVQGVGHQREATPSIPFAGPGDAASRILVEQFITFPRFVLSGGFGRALRNSRASR
jgi:uncharacterized membrane protein YGL010W